MKRLTQQQYEAKLAAAHPHFKPLDTYAKACVPLTVLCERCGNTITREAAVHLRYDCPHCRTISMQLED